MPKNSNKGAHYEVTHPLVERVGRGGLWYRASCYACTAREGCKCDAMKSPVGEHGRVPFNELNILAFKMVRHKSLEERSIS